jgi:hypothetical protein
VSFRVAKGVYVGKRAYVSKDHLDRTATGTVILTNQRIVFVSASKTITIQIGNIITARAAIVFKCIPRNDSARLCSNFRLHN